MNAEMDKLESLATRARVFPWMFFMLAKQYAEQASSALDKMDAALAIARMHNACGGGPDEAREAVRDALSEATYFIMLIAARDPVVTELEAKRAAAVLAEIDALNRSPVDGALDLL